MFFVALDIGYGDSKIAYGHSNSKIDKFFKKTSTAAHLSKLPVSIFNNDFTGMTKVSINDTEWVTGFEPGIINGYSRELHHEFTQTDQFMALFLSSLSNLPQNHVDLLITGLPVHQYQNEIIKKRLQNQLRGTFKINDERSITIKKCMVLPQPYGAYCELENNANNKILKVLKYGSTLIIDPGHFSLDYVLMDSGRLQRELSGSTFDSTSQLFESTQYNIGQAGHIAPTIDRIEHAIVNDQSFLFSSGEEIIIKPFFDKAIQEITQNSLRVIKKKFINQMDHVDLIIICGASAKIFEAPVKNAFPFCKNIYIPKKPSFSNVLGYWHAGCKAYGK